MKKITKKSCPACHFQISASNYLRHTDKCVGQGTWKNQELVRKEQVKTLIYCCKTCNKVFGTAQALSGHMQRSHVLIDKQKIYGKKGAAVLAEKVACGEINLSHPHTEAMKDYLSIKACERLAKHSKYSKNTEYAPGIILESSYELETAIILDSLAIKWIKVRQGYKWDDNGKTRRYVPDFYLPDYDLFLDPKNDYLIKKDKRKIESAMQLNNIKIIVLDKTQITKDFIQNILL